jgi:hypothetical protein
MEKFAVVLGHNFVPDGKHYSMSLCLLVLVSMVLDLLQHQQHAVNK